LKQKRKITSTSRATLEDMRMTKAHQVNVIRLSKIRLVEVKKKNYFDLESDLRGYEDD
jgi:hypothetical protein